ncbi:hypothetical protein ARMGADRAFT_1089633 [Armillaria gallica]|uniref:Uncharacterized protein n=1 Tax=Armillaria gallica TaxID=47427 RepID=A0A2H3CJ07_ARMGA|nr:hypothetical protein ARMGADRAFT_1089633 [Armillaria gallica]
MYLFGPEGLLISLRLSDHDDDDKFAADNGLPTGLVIKVKMLAMDVPSSCFLQNAHALGTGYLIGVGLNSVLGGTPGCELSVPSSNARDLFLVEGFALDRDEMLVGMHAGWRIGAIFSVLSKDDGFVSKMGGLTDFKGLLTNFGVAIMYQRNKILLKVRVSPTRPSRLTAAQGSLGYQNLLLGEGLDKYENGVGVIAAKTVSLKRRGGGGHGSLALAIVGVRSSELPMERDDKGAFLQGDVHMGWKQCFDLSLSCNDNVLGVYVSVRMAAGVLMERLQIEK